MTSSSTPAAPASWRQRIIGTAAFRVESLLVLAVLCVLMATLSSAFLSVSNVLNILLSTSVFGVLAIGMTFVICSAGIDLSVGSILALSGVVGAMLTSNLDLPWWIGIAGCLAMGAFVGASTASSSPRAQFRRSSLRSACSASRADSRWC